MICNEPNCPAGKEEHDHCPISQMPMYNRPLKLPIAKWDWHPEDETLHQVSEGDYFKCGTCTTEPEHIPTDKKD